MINMNGQLPLSHYLTVNYPFDVVADPDGGFVIRFPDLPGCMTQIDSIEAVGQAAAEIKELWIETEYERGAEIPAPSYPETYSGKFNLRLPKSLHRRLVEQADAEAVSLNQIIVSMLSERLTGDVHATLRTIVVMQSEMRDSLAVLAAQTNELRAQTTTYAVEDEHQAGARGRTIEVVDAGCHRR